MYYYSWDISILFLYILKVRQIHKKGKHIQTEKVNSNKIKLILLKIVILTLFWELDSFVISAVYFGTKYYTIYNPIISPIIWCIDYLIAYYIVILMMEHNNHKYLTLIKVLNKCGLFCCCKQLVTNSIADATYLKIDISNSGHFKSNRPKTKLKFMFVTVLPLPKLKFQFLNESNHIRRLVLYRINDEIYKVIISC